MITLFYSSRACSLASHITLEEAGAPYTLIVRVQYGGAIRDVVRLFDMPSGRCGMPTRSPSRGLEPGRPTGSAMPVVNIATYLLVDGFENDYEGAVIISNDSDLAVPIRVVRTKLRRRVFVLHPCSRGSRSPSIELRKAAGLRSGAPALVVNPALLAAHQFPPTLRDATGTFHKPATC